MRNKKMKIFFLLLFFPVMSFAQKDFDYVFYTSHATITVIGNKPDTLKNLLLLRAIEKQNNVLKIINTNNTADCLTYQLQFVGWQADNNQYVYMSTDAMIYCNPMQGWITIESKSSKSEYY